MNAKDLLKVLDHTFLKDESSGLSPANQMEFIGVLIDRANQAGCYAVCVRDRWTQYSRKLLDELGSSCQLAVTIGFPDGDSFETVEKLESLSKASELGAQEFDTVLRVQDLKQGKSDTVYREIFELSKASAEKVLKVILEVDKLTAGEKKIAAMACLEAFRAAGATGRRFLKTSTGFVPAELNPKGATLEDLQALIEWGQGAVGIKASGGVSSVEKAFQFASLFGENGLNPMYFRIGSSNLLDRIFGVKTGSQPGY